MKKQNPVTETPAASAESVDETPAKAAPVAMTGGHYLWLDLETTPRRISSHSVKNPVTETPAPLLEPIVELTVRG